MFVNFADLALKMAKDYDKLATARYVNNKTALHLLAKTPEAFADGNSEGWSKLFNIGNILTWFIFRVGILFLNTLYIA